MRMTHLQPGNLNLPLQGGCCLHCYYLPVRTLGRNGHSAVREKVAARPPARPPTNLPGQASQDPVYLALTCFTIICPQPAMQRPVAVRKRKSKVGRWPKINSKNAKDGVQCGAAPQSIIVLSAALPNTCTPFCCRLYLVLESSSLLLSSESCDSRPSEISVLKGPLSPPSL